MKIKSRRDREKDYARLYGNISTDVYQRLSDKLGSKFNEELIYKFKDRIKEARDNIKYYSIDFTFYEVPVQSHRPRVNYHTRGLHVPNAKENYDAIEKMIKDIKDDLFLIATPMKVVLKAYYPMPENVNPLDMIMYETENDYAIGKPDFDNVLKAYTDMIQKHIILDDDLVSSCKFDKYYSLKPRVEMKVIYTNGYVSEYTYKTITNRTSFKNNKDHIDVKLLVTSYKKKKRGKKHER